MAPDEERALRLAPQREPLVAGLVDLVLRARRGDLLLKPLPSPFPRLGPGDALRAVLVSGQLLQLTEFRNGPFR